MNSFSLGVQYKYTTKLHVMIQSVDILNKFTKFTHGKTVFIAINTYHGSTQLKFVIHSDLTDSNHKKMNYYFI